MDPVSLLRGALVVACVATALYRLRAGVFLWMALAATTVNVPLVSVRTTHVHFAVAYLVVLLFLWLGGMVWRGKWEISRSRLDLPLLVLAATAAISSILGNVLYDPEVAPDYWFLAVQVYATALVCLSAAAALLVGNTVKTISALRWMYWIVVGVGLAFVVSAFLPHPIFSGEPNWWPLVMAHGIALTYARLLSDRSWPWWAKLLGVAIVAAGWSQAVLPQLLHPEVDGQWLAGWIAVTVPLLVITCIRHPWGALSVSVPAAVAFTARYLDEVIAQARYEGALARVGLWLDAGRLALLRPFFGVGPGNYPDYMNAYGQQWVINTSAHGNYQQVAAEMGFLGLAALLWVLVEALLLAWRLYRSLEEPFLRSFALGVVGSVCAMAAIGVVGDYLLPAYHNGGHTSICTTIYFWMLVGALMAIESIGGARARSKPPREEEHSAEGLGEG